MSTATATPTGLTTEQVNKAHREGQSNKVDTATSRPISAILRANLFTVFNGILITAMIAVLAVGDWRDAVFGFVLVLNLIIGVFSELRSKRALDKLAVLTAPTITVWRDGEEEQVPTEDLVIDDVVSLKMGDQVPADGIVSSSHGLSVDESALTGESKPVRKKPGDKILSGTSIVGGSGTMTVKVIGQDSWAQKITKEAKQFSKVHSEIQGSIDKVLTWITWILPVVVIILLWSQVRTGNGWRDAVILTVAGIVGMIPQGLVLLTSMNFGIAAASLARKNVLVQELPAVEILARVDVLCLDKTGTITTGAIRGRELDAAPMPQADAPSEEQAKAALKVLVADATNATAVATMQLVEDAHATKHDDDDLLPFNSERKWSAYKALQDGKPLNWLFGAPEILLAGDLPKNQWARDIVKGASAHGRRTTVLVYYRGRFQGEVVPEDVTAALVVVLEEDVRPDAKQTLEYFEKQGVAVKVISGDAPETVGAIAKEVGLHSPDGGEPHVMDARKLPPIGTPEFKKAALATDVFGRVTPDQKQALVVALQDSGHTVAMTGDGVNDALALKTADLGIAMGNAAPATKTVARIVLVNGEFSVLPGVVGEGRRIIANMERVSALFLSKTTYAIMLAVLVALFGWAYPFLPRHLTYISAFTIGVPGFFLALAPNSSRYRQGFLRRTLSIAVPSGILLGAGALTSYLIAGQGTLSGHTAATLTLIIAALSLLVILARPWNAWRISLVAAMGAGAVIGLIIPFVRNFFALEWPDHRLWALIGVVGLMVSALVALSYHITQKWRDAPVVTKIEAKKEDSRETQEA